MAEAANADKPRLKANSSSNLNPRQHNLVRKKFDKHDTGGDGVLDRDEFVAMFPPEQRRRSIMMFKKLDKTKSGFIEFDEFCSAAEQVKKNYDQKKRQSHLDRRSLLLPMKRLFQRLDSNSDRRLSPKEFSRLWRVLNIPQEAAEATMRSLFKIADENKDGFISHREFKNTFIETGLLNEVCESVFSAELSDIPSKKKVVQKKVDKDENVKLKSLQQTFNSLDTDKDGLLTLNQLREFCRSVYVSNIDGVVNSVDPKDGKFPFDEFVDCMSRAVFMTGAEIEALQKQK